MGSHSETPNTQHPKHQAIRMKLGGVLLSSLLSLLPRSLCDPEADELRRVKEGEEYELPRRRQGRERGFSSQIASLRRSSQTARGGRGPRAFTSSPQRILRSSTMSPCQTTEDRCSLL